MICRKKQTEYEAHQYKDMDEFFKILESLKIYGTLSMVKPEFKGCFYIRYNNNLRYWNISKGDFLVIFSDTNIWVYPEDKFNEKFDIVQK